MKIIELSKINFTIQYGKLLFVSLVYISTLACGQKRSCESFREYNHFAQNTSNINDTSSLIRKLNTLIENDSSCIDIFMARANLYFFLDSMDLALLDYKKILQMDSNNIYSLYRSGLIYQQKEKDSLAIILFNKAIGLKKIGDAVIDYSKSSVNSENDKSKYDIQSTYIIYAEGVSYYYLGMLDSALSDFEFCINKEFALDQAYLYRGSIYIEKKKMTEACSDLKESAKLGNLKAKLLLTQYCKTP